MGKIIWAGLPLLLINDWMGLSFYHAMSVPLWLMAAIDTIKGIVFLLLVFFGTGWIVTLLGKCGLVKAIFDKIIYLISQAGENSYRTRRRKFNEKAVHWFLIRKEWMVLTAAFVPWVPVLSTIVIVAVRLMRIRHGLLFLLLATVFKALVLCWTIYYLFPLP